MNLQHIAYGVLFLSALLPCRGVAAESGLLSLTSFGSYFKLDGSSEQIWKRTFIGPSGAIGSIVGREIIVREVAPGSPADGLLREGDVILSADGHELGDDPRVGFGYAVGDVQERDGKLKMDVYRDGKFMQVVVSLPVLGPTPANWPLEGGEKSRVVHRQFCDYIARNQARENIPAEMRPFPSSSGLILLAHPDPKYLEAARRLAYIYVRNPSKMAGMGSWDCGYTAIYLAEYFMVTGDRAVLPELERLCREIARGQAPCGSWSHGAWTRGAETYAIGGIVNQCGLACWTGLIMAGNAGVPVDETAMRKAAAFFGQYADRGSIPYGDHEPWMGPIGNGKNGFAAVAFDLLGEHAKSRQFARYVTDWYSDWEGGHTGDYFAYVWTVLGGLRTPEVKDCVAQVRKHIWFYDMDRSWDGAGLLNDSVDYNGRGLQACTPAVGMPFAIAAGRQRLALMGAPRSPFCPGEYSKVIGQARQLHFDRKWDEVEKLLADREFSGDEAVQSAWIRDAAKAALATVDLTLAGVRKNLDARLDPELAIRQLEDLKVLLGKDDARVDELLALAKDHDRLKGYYDAAAAFKKCQWLVPVDDGARREMERLAKDPSAGRYQELAKEQVADRLGSFKFLYEIEDLYQESHDASKWDNGRSHQFKLFKRISEALGSSWPQWVARDALRQNGYLQYDNETIKGWAELVPVSDTRGKPKTARILPMMKDSLERTANGWVMSKSHEGKNLDTSVGFDHGPEGWMQPGFDDSAWDQGEFPIGYGGPVKTSIEGQYRGFYARIRFNLEDTCFSRLRLLFRFRHFANVYLNGHLVSRVLYYGDGGDRYEMMELKDEVAALLKPGENLLAIEGAWHNLWWGIIDAGLYGIKAQGTVPVKTEPAATLQQVAAAPVIKRSERYAPQTGDDARIEAMKKLAQASTAQLVEQLSDEWLASRDWASRALADRGAAAMPDIIGAFESSDGRVRAGACQAINYMGNGARTHALEAVDGLVKLLDDKESYVQYTAGTALAKIGKIPDKAIPGIQRMLGVGSSWWPRIAAQAMLKCVEPSKIIDALIQDLVGVYGNETNFAVREQQAEFLGRWYSQHQDGDTLDKLTAAVAAHEGDWECQSRLYGLLKAMGPKAKPAVPVVEEALRKNAADKARSEFLKDVLGKISAQ